MSSTHDYDELVNCDKASLEEPEVAAARAMYRADAMLEQKKSAEARRILERRRGEQR